MGHPVKHKGYGLSHIIDKHEAEIKQLGFEIEDFVPIVVQFGELAEKKSDDKKSHWRALCSESSYRRNGTGKTKRFFFPLLT